MARPTDAITLLETDHKEVGELLDGYEKLGDGQLDARRDLAGRIIREMTAHIHIEETVFYPRVRDVGSKVKDEVLEGIEEHHLIKTALHELEGMDPGDERYDAKVEVLAELIRHHHSEEETDLFPRVRRALDTDELVRLAEEMEEARSTAPAHPAP
jgi:hemerythrin superfamily protein